jgi:predicted nucleic acid-binding protein
LNITRRYFVDTNVFVYSLDASEPERRERATQVIIKVRQLNSGAVSPQVLGETFVTLLRLGATHTEASYAVDEMIQMYPVGEITPDNVNHAISLTSRFSLSYYDALIISAAQDRGAQYLLTEDLQAEQVIEGVHVLHVLDPDFDLSRLD